MSRRNVDNFSTRLISPPFRLVSHRKHLVGPMSSVILAVRIRELLARLGLARFEIVQGRKIARMMWQMRLKSSGRNLRVMAASDGVTQFAPAVNATAALELVL
ncbi:hypothetical protein SNK03_001502 [Fusarium graminearum]|uniref:Chromosome 1, complete genome n=1 Tax=Gibberella zeae (strain ATCC MYA-4620 / CBS 123657 / FGSC 9075 / NRRL 31084 / PH-1) TaxID=229533 RepID=I1S511_GIBZE|nr:hypothetical protein FGSG_11929 [Fusarium graminearum PH-1]ESU06609.1 hypothetical protein FGSG_11929 [Fusarium graminearum PH-1]EYB22528.1 hypothetical protein FG05_11929 [Fusarium graminearum]CEF73422.1 unnamed protein product [Fusarium graminearum]CZS76693.1 unnamed protein product [Fusarium graminearum]|eukprot:XP_011317094.1 hypothetical protein FGSG_11929 [Fusarium graminearum PH-1]